MLVAILSLLGVPLWLCLGWLGAALWHRRDLKKNLPGMFKMKVRVVEGNYRYLDGNFGHIAGLGYWAHDILLAEKGLLLARNLHFPVADGLQQPQPADPKQVKKRLGDSPVTMQFRLDDGTVIEVAASSKESTLAQGPFFSNTAYICLKGVNPNF